MILTCLYVHNFHSSVFYKFKKIKILHSATVYGYLGVLQAILVILWLLKQVPFQMYVVLFNSVFFICNFYFHSFFLIKTLLAPFQKEICGHRACINLICSGFYYFCYYSYFSLLEMRTF